MEQIKHDIHNLILGNYYKFCYSDGDKIIGHSRQNHFCHAGIRDSDINEANTLWTTECTFCAAEYALDATPEETAWLQHCVMEERHMTFKEFLLKFHTPKEITNYSVF
jgi:hypothetical protein